ncbi:MAG: hypothetical protein ICV81_06355 [Flavisolibacter sp.]|nr:hypothetical protein [Flavisolibacter sp.]MBD0288859.1 hypothetical protein [Flavisolibacter sp.]
MIATAEKWIKIDSMALRYFGEYYCLFKKDYGKSTGNSLKEKEKERKEIEAVEEI